jgi:hypothetical protein
MKCRLKTNRSTRCFLEGLHEDPKIRKRDFFTPPWEMSGVRTASCGCICRIPPMSSTGGSLAVATSHGEADEEHNVNQRKD